VFGREAGYNTNHDPIVRITALEIRKRVAQYYHEPGHESGIRIELPQQVAKVKRRWRRRRMALTGIAARVVILTVTAILLRRTGTAAFRFATDDFWAPVVSSSGAVLMCIGQLPNDAVDGPRSQQTVDNYVSTTKRIALSDGIALPDLAGFLA
jgi:hypothetical protein